MRNFTYNPVSKTIMDFHNDTSFMKLIAGPVGSGKSSAIVAELLFRAMRQPPNNNGVRQTRMGIFRQTYPKLKTTSIKTVDAWVPKEFGSVKETVPITAMYRFNSNFDDGTVVETEWLFMAIDNNLDKLLSLELSAAYLNEGTEMQEMIVNQIASRVGRYPAVKDGVSCAEPGLIVDFNLPAKSHWIYKLAMLEPETTTRELGTKKPDGSPDTITITKKFFMQPPAAFCDNLKEVNESNVEPIYRLNPEADNLKNLIPQYYAAQLLQHPTREQWVNIQRQVLMQWAEPIQGKLVFENEYRHDIHIAKTILTPQRGYPVIIGIDTSGLHPCAVFCQQINKSVRVLHTLFGDNVSFNTFVTDMLVPMINALYPGMKVIAVCDPANARGSDTGITPIQQLIKNGIEAIPAATNEFKLRKEAVSQLLVRVDGLQISPNCTELINGFEVSYAYPELSVHSDIKVYGDKPDKRLSVSHYMDSLQYAALYITRVGEYQRVLTTKQINSLRLRPLA